MNWLIDNLSKTHEILLRQPRNILCRCYGPYACRDNVFFTAHTPYTAWLTGDLDRRYPCLGIVLG